MSWQAEQCKALAQHYLTEYGAEDTILADLLGERFEDAAKDWLYEWFESGDRPALAVIPGGRYEYPDFQERKEER